MGDREAERICGDRNSGGKEAGGRGQEPMKKGEIWDKIGQTEDGRQEFMRKEATIN